jgi:hypothetical protein
MTNIIEAYQQKMRMVPDNGLPDNELVIVDELLKSPPDEADTILEWIFAEHKGYIEARARAGLKFLEKNPMQGWFILETLINSRNPDDRDTGLTVLGRSGNADKYYLAKPILNDPYPYLQFDAVELLQKIYPEEVKSILWSLATHETVWVRENAQKLLLQMGENVETVN